MENGSMFGDIREQIRSAVERLGYSMNIYKYLRNPRRTLEVHIPVVMDDGRLETFLGYRSQHAALFGPYKGGIRIHPKVNKEEVEALAILMTLKSALLGLPYGGGKGGIICDAESLSTGEKERLLRGYIRGIRDMIGPMMDIPAPDVGTDARAMAWMLDEYLKNHHEINFAVFTGKQLNIGGIEGRAGATGLGIAIIVREACRRLNLPLAGATVAIVGFGNVGQGAARAIHNMGGRIVAITDIYGGVYQPEGLDMEQIWAYAAEHRTIAGFPGVASITNEELFALDVDVVVPAAMENQITAPVAETIRARIVAEGANGPTTSAGDQVLQNRDIPVIPDILTNSGGVTVSYFEWVQGQQGGLRWPLAAAEEQLDTYMTTAFQHVWQMAEKHRCSLREAAYMHAIDRLAQAMLERGWINSLTDG